MSKISTIDINNAILSITKIKDEDYICLTDMAKSKGGDSRAADVIKNWIRTRTTIEFLGTWETMYNPNFKVVESDHFKMEAGLPTNEKGFVVGEFRWQEGFGAFSYAKSQLDTVIEYINNQEQHQQKITFRDEYIELLQKFNVDYDEKYLFEWIE